MSITRTKKEELNTGITLIALVITIIVLLILAGISIAMLTGDNGILNKATTAKEETIKAQYEEELNLVITEMRTDAIYKNEQFNMTYVIEKLPEYLEANGEEDYIWEIEDNTIEEPEGEYKDYIFYIDTNYIVHVETQTGGIKPDISAEVITTGNVLEGNTVEIQVTASIAEGTVTIKEVENSIETKHIKDENQNKIYIFKVNKNGKYTFIAESDRGRKNRTTVNINNIIEAPIIEISDNDTGTSFKVNVVNNYPENANITYTYKLDTVEKANNIESKNYVMDNLISGTEYIVQVVAVFEGNNLLSEELKVTTISLAPIIKISGGLEKAALEYPVFTECGMANCSLTGIEQGSNLAIEITKRQKEDANIFYSLDNGNTWIPYTQSFQIQYTGKNEIRAKCVNSKGTEFKSRAMLCGEYAYDSEFDCTAEDALDKKAYDGDERTYMKVRYGDVEGAKRKFYFGHASLYNLVVGVQNEGYFYIYPSFGGNLCSNKANEWYWNGNLGYACYPHWSKRVSDWEGKSVDFGTDDRTEESSANIYEIWYDASLYSED